MKASRPNLELARVGNGKIRALEAKSTFYVRRFMNRFAMRRTVGLVDCYGLRVSGGLALAVLCCVPPEVALKRLVFRGPGKTPSVACMRGFDRYNNDFSPSILVDII
jgi:hypothetical protein